MGWSMRRAWVRTQGGSEGAGAPLTSLPSLRRASRACASALGGLGGHTLTQPPQNLRIAISKRCHLTSAVSERLPQRLPQNDINRLQINFRRLPQTSATQSYAIVSASALLRLQPFADHEALGLGVAIDIDFQELVHDPLLRHLGENLLVDTEFLCHIGR